MAGAVGNRWKAFERWVASMIRGKRYWANAGEQIDCESDRFTAQCKYVRECSLPKLTELATQAQAEGRERNKIGLVAARLSGQRGPVSTPTLFVFHEDAFRELMALLPEQT